MFNIDFPETYFLINSKSHYRKLGMLRDYSNATSLSMSKYGQVKLNIDTITSAAVSQKIDKQLIAKYREFIAIVSRQRH